MKHAMLVLLLAATLCPGQGTFMVGFDGLPMLGSGEVRGTTEYDESGMRFYELYSSPLNNVVRMRGPYNSFPSNGTVYFGGSPSITNVTAFSLLSGVSFTLISVELSDYSPGFSNQPDTVRFIGHRADGSAISMDIALQHLVENGRATFQTSFFGPEFTDLSWVEIPTHYWWMDNLVFSVVPEPSTVVLFGMGSLIFLANQVRKRRSRQ